MGRPQVSVPTGVSVHKIVACATKLHVSCARIGNAYQHPLSSPVRLAPDTPNSLAEEEQNLLFSPVLLVVIAAAEIVWGYDFVPGGWAGQPFMYSASLYDDSDELWNRDPRQIGSPNALCAALAGNVWASLPTAC